MLVYIIVILFIILLQLNLSGMKAGVQRNKTENRYFKFICWVLVLLAALRGITVGTDTIGYWEDYEAMSDISFFYILVRYRDYPIFFLLAKLCSVLGLPVQVLFGIIEGIYVLAIYQFIKRYSNDQLYSILGFTVIGLYSFSLAGLKQDLSMAFILFCYMALEDKKYVRALLLVVLSYFCHHASLVFLGGVALYFIRSWRHYYLYLVIIMIAVLFGTQYLWGQMLTLLENNHYTELYLEDEGYSSTTMIIYGVLLAILVVFSNRYRHQHPIDSRIMLGMSSLAFVLQAFSFVSSTAFRLSFYFLPFMVVAFPNAFNCIENQDRRRWARIGVEVLLIFIFIYTNYRGSSIVPYVFFWQT